MINLVFLGKKGAGVDFLEGFQQEILLRDDSDNFKFIVSSASDFPDKNLGIEMLRVDALHNPRDIIKIWKCIKSIREIRFKLHENGTEIINIFIMPAFTDWFFLQFIRNKTCKNLFIIHDAVRHPGDSWPSKAAIRWRIKRGDVIVTLSDFVKKRLKDIYHFNNVHVLQHPVFNSNDSIRPKELPYSEEKLILFVGRILDYKGLKFLYEATRNLESEYKLVVAGEGNLQFNMRENVILINRWLTSDEIRYLIEVSEVVVFPYIEASQSGLIPLARFLGKTILATNVGGLLEQLQGYEKTVTCNPGNTLELERAIRVAINIGNGSIPKRTTTSYNSFYREMIELAMSKE